MLISTGEAALRLGVTYRRIEQLIDKKQLPAIQVAGRWLIEEADLAGFTRTPPGRPKKPAK